VGVPVTDSSAAGHLAEPPVELVGRVGVAVLVAEHEVVIVPGLASCPAFVSLPGLVYRQRDDCALGSSSERFDLGVLVSPLLLAERQTWTTPLLRSTWSHVSLRSSPGAGRG
jgi:hypothetical protein